MKKPAYAAPNSGLRELILMLLQRSNVGPSGNGPTFLGAVLADP
jgi:hypothetical protein